MKKKYLKKWVEKTLRVIVAFLVVTLLSVNDFTSLIGVVIYFLAAIICAVLAKILYKYGRISC